MAWVWTWQKRPGMKWHWLRHIGKLSGGAYTVLQFDVFSADKFCQCFRKYFNFRSKTQHLRTALWGKGLWEKEKKPPSMVIGRGSPTPHYKDVWGQPMPLQWLGCVLREWLFTVPCLQDGVSLGFLVLLVCFFAVILWCWARSPAPHVPHGKCLGEHVFW